MAEGSRWLLARERIRSRPIRVTYRVGDLNRSHPFYQATWYHNALFNPNLPADARVLAFVRRTHDSAERRAALLEKLAGTFFQRPARFSDTLTALFLPGSELAGCLVSDRDCVLDFQRGVTRLSDRSGEKCPSRVRGPAR